MQDIAAIMAADPYIDHDGDGWAPGPKYSASGLTEVLFLLTDPDDSNAEVQVVLPNDVWEQISKAILTEILAS